MRRPLVPLVISYLSGIIIGSTFPLNLGIIVSYAIATIIIGFILYCFWSPSRKVLYIILSLSLPLLTGQAYITLLNKYTHYYPANHLINLSFPNPIDLEGQLYTVPEKFPKKTRLYLNDIRVWDRKGKQQVLGRVRINVYGPINHLALGDRIKIKGLKLYPPRGFRNFHGFDYQEYLARKGIYALGGVRDVSRIEIVEEGNSWSCLRYIAAVKDRMLDFIDRSSPQPQGAVLKAMVLGDKSSLSRESKELFKKAGIAHLLVVSGLHIGFVTLAFFWLVRPILSLVRFRLLSNLPYVLRPSKLALALSVFPVIFYVLLVGGGSATSRATITTLIFILILLQDRSKDLYSATALAAFLLLLWRPYNLFEPGFQFSFIVVLAIAHIVSRMNSPYKIISQKPDDCKEPTRKSSLSRSRIYHYICITFFTTLATYPLTAYYFHQISLVAPLANAIIIPLGSLAVPLGLIASGIALIWEPLAQLLLYLTTFLLTAILYLTDLLLNLPGVLWHIPKFSVFNILSFYLLLFILSSYQRGQKRYGWFGIAAGTFLIIGLLAQYLPTRKDSLLKVYFLDVGEGDATFIKTPGGKTMLIDSGGIYSDTFDIGEDVIAPFIWNQGLRKLDYLIATHPDRDHIRGFNGLLKNFPVKTFWHNGAPEEYHFPRGFKKLIRQRKVDYSSPRNRYGFLLDHGVWVQVFNLREILNKRLGRLNRLNDNNKSLVIQLRYGRISFLFTADIEKLAEHYLSQETKGLKSTILKVAHHGSRSSSGQKFLEKIRPEIAIISVGSHNPFGHPSPIILERLKQLGVRIYRTDLQGAIQITTNGQTYSVKTWAEDQARGSLRQSSQKMGYSNGIWNQIDLPHVFSSGLASLGH
jgi:competence protein ComEC